jgi:hypothetical protein
MIWEEFQEIPIKDQEEMFNLFIHGAYPESGEDMIEHIQECDQCRAAMADKFCQFMFDNQSKVN